MKTGITYISGYGIVMCLITSFLLIYKLTTEIIHNQATTQDIVHTVCFELFLILMISFLVELAQNFSKKK